MKVIFPVLFIFLAFHTATAQMHLTEFPEASLETENATRFPYFGKLGLAQNSPNPFTARQTTAIHYKAIDASHVVIVVYDEDGHKALVFENLPPQTGKVTIRGSQLAPGDYTYALIVDGRMVSKMKMTNTL